MPPTWLQTSHAISRRCAFWVSSIGGDGIGFVVFVVTDAVIELFP